MTETEHVSPGPFVPSRYRVVDRKTENSDITTLWLEPVDRPIAPFKAGQFNMLTAFGVGEVAISISSAPGAPGAIEHTVRDVGAVSHALASSQIGDVVGLRGPFGTDWGLESLTGCNVVVVVGGIGLAPLRGATSPRTPRPTARSCCASAPACRTRSSSQKRWNAGGRWASTSR